MCLYSYQQAMSSVSYFVENTVRTVYDWFNHCLSERTNVCSLKYIQFFFLNDVKLRSIIYLIKQNRANKIIKWLKLFICIFWYNMYHWFVHRIFSYKLKYCIERSTSFRYAMAYDLIVWLKMVRGSRPLMERNGIHITLIRI